LIKQESYNSLTAMATNPVMVAHRTSSDMVQGGLIQGGLTAMVTNPVMVVHRTSSDMV
jgi:hypothetical protein